MIDREICEEVSHCGVTTLASLYEMRTTQGGVVTRYLPALLPSESLVQKGKNFWYVELDILEVQLVLSVFLHLQEII